MKKTTAYSLLSSLISLLSTSTAWAEDERTFLSVVPRPTLNQAKTSSPAPERASATKPAEKANLAQGAKEETQANPQTTDPIAGDTDKDAGTSSSPVKTLYSQALEQACKQYRANPSSSAYSQLLSALKSCLASGPYSRISAAVLVKDNPYLNDFKPRVQECNGVRIWSFPKAPDKSRVLLQWTETQQQLVGSGRRRHLVTSSSMHLQELALSTPVAIKDAGIIALKDLGKFLLISGDSEDGSLKLRAYRLAEGLWQESPEFLAQIPEFLYNNVSGRLGFKGSELVFNIGKMIETTDANGAKRYLPEAESQTYKFWLKTGESGWFISQSLPNEDAFSVVYQFMQAVAQARTDLEKSLLTDPRLASLPKYLGLQGKAIDPSVKVVEMTMPPGKGSRFRLINLGKDDLIFDVGKIKNQWQVKAIFVAEPDPFLMQTSKYFPNFSKFEPKLEAAEKPAQQIPGGGGGGSATARRK